MTDAGKGCCYAKCADPPPSRARDDEPDTAARPLAATTTATTWGAKPTLSHDHVVRRGHRSSVFAGIVGASMVALQCTNRFRTLQINARDSSTRVRVAHTKKGVLKLQLYILPVLGLYVFTHLTAGGNVCMYTARSTQITT